MEKKALSAIYFKDALVTCHDVNPFTRDDMETVMGFNTGDVLWYSPISGKFVQMNKKVFLQPACFNSAEQSILLILYRA